MTSAAPAAREFPRRFVSPDADFGDWSAAERHFRELADRPLRSADELEQWLLDWSELDACFGEAGIAREIAYTQATDDPQRKQANLDFIEHVKPRREPWVMKLRRRLVDEAPRLRLPPRRYDVLLRKARTAVEIYRDENLPLLVEDDKLIARHKEITGAMTVHFDGREQTLQQMALYLEQTDRTLRESAWRSVTARWLADRDALNDLYERMIAVRTRIARNAGLPDYRDYAFKMRQRFDYTPDDCLRFHDAIEEIVVPARRKLSEHRREKLALPSLRPWDFDVDPDNRPPLRPFDNAGRLADGCREIFRRVDPEFARIFDTMRQRGMLDLESRKGKAPGGYQETFHEQRMPFIFMNAVGTEADVSTLLHEGGHAFHTWSCRNEPLEPYRDYPIEFAEVASMGMECLAHPHLEEFYGPDAGRARRRHLTDIVNFLPYMARVDAFQHYVYTHPDHDMPRRLDEWARLRRRFAPDEDWSGLEEAERHSWHRKLHFFQVPFYYIEYGIAQLGALQVWLNARRDPARAVAMYRAGLTLGGSRPLPELFETAGCRFDFTAATLRPLVDAVMQEIES